jgi:serine/threonine-protein phosphatase 2A regulatory subunit B
LLKGSCAKWFSVEDEIGATQPAGRDRRNCEQHTASDLFAHVREGHTFSDGVSYNTNRLINAVSFTTDGETFLTSTPLKVSLWNVNSTREAFATVQLRTQEEDDNAFCPGIISDFVTSVHASPIDASQFIYCSTNGKIRLGDLRVSSLCDTPARTWQNYQFTANQFSHVGVALSDVKYSPCGRMILSRDAMTLKIWDTRFEASPIRTIAVFETLSDITEIIRDGGAYDAFRVAWSGDSTKVLTGSYGSAFYLCDAMDGNERLYMAAGKSQAKSPRRRKDHFHHSRTVLNVAYNPRMHHVCLGRYDAGFIHRQVSTVAAAASQSKH